MLSWRSFNVDEMVSATFVEKGPLPLKEEVHWRVLSVVSFVIIRGSLSSARNASRPDTIIRVAADHDGVVPGCPGEGTIVADVVLDIVDDGALEDPVER